MTRVGHPVFTDRRSKLEQAASAMLRNQDDGELTTKGNDGRIRNKDTLTTGADPNSAKGQGVLMADDHTLTIHNPSTSSPSGS